MAVEQRESVNHKLVADGQIHDMMRCRRGGSCHSVPGSARVSFIALTFVECHQRPSRWLRWPVQDIGLNVARHLPHPYLPARAEMCEVK